MKIETRDESGLPLSLGRQASSGAGSATFEAQVALGATGATGVRFLGRYRLMSELGSGAYATVHLARLDGPNGFKRYVAIEALHPRFVGDEAFIKAFLDGARDTAQLSHPNIATVFEMGRDGDAVWVAREYVHGEPLCDLLAASRRQGRTLPWALAFKIVADIAAGLHACHEGGPRGGRRGSAGGPARVHGALSSASVVVGYDGVSKLVDVGAPQAGPRPADTAPSLILRHIPYAAPEQLSPGAPLDPRTDVFRAGVLLWELLTGRRPHAHASELEVLAGIERGEFPSAATLVPNLPPGAASVVERALCREASRRYGSAKDFAKALMGQLGGGGAEAGPDDVAEFVAACFPERRDAREAELDAADDATEIFHRPMDFRPGRPVQVDLGPARTEVTQPLRVRFDRSLDAALDPSLTPRAAAKVRGRRGWLVGMLAASVILGLAALAVLAFPMPRKLAVTAATATAPFQATASSVIPAASPPPTPVASTAATTATAATPDLPATPAAVPVRAEPRSAPVRVMRARVETKPEEVDLPPATRGALSSKGLLTIVCYPACDEIEIDRERVGPSPVFKHAVPAGRHRVLLRTLEPKVTKALDIVVTPSDQATVLRQSMAP